MSMTLTRMWLGTTVAMLFMVGWWLQSAAEAEFGATKSVPGGGVTVAVTFLKEGSDGPAFRVVLDTHSVNLDGYRFEEVVRLRDGTGGELAPTAVENPQGGGHHRSATVRFAWPEPRPKSLELIVKGVAGVPERLFQWTLE
jgi:hypothetical protein